MTVLLEAGADMNVKNIDGFSAFDMTNVVNRKGAAELLQRYGCKSAWILSRPLQVVFGPMKPRKSSEEKDNEDHETQSVPYQEQDVEEEFDNELGSYQVSSNSPNFIRQPQIRTSKKKRKSSIKKKKSTLLNKHNDEWPEDCDNNNPGNEIWPVDEVPEKENAIRNIPNVSDSIWPDEGGAVDTGEK